MINMSRFVSSEFIGTSKVASTTPLNYRHKNLNER